MFLFSRLLPAVPFSPYLAARSLESAIRLACNGRESWAGIPSEDQPDAVEPRLEPNVTRVRASPAKTCYGIKELLNDQAASSLAFIELNNSLIIDQQN